MGETTSQGESQQAQSDDSGEKHKGWRSIIRDSITKLCRNLINIIRIGEFDFERGVGERRSLSSGRSEIHEGASLVIGTNARTSEEGRRNPQEEYAFDAEEGKEFVRKLISNIASDYRGSETAI